MIIGEVFTLQLSKGYQVLIEGQLRQDRWEDKNGEKRSKVKIVADRVVLISNVYTP